MRWRKIRVRRGRKRLFDAVDRWKIGGKAVGVRKLRFFSRFLAEADGCGEIKTEAENK